MPHVDALWRIRRHSSASPATAESGMNCEETPFEMALRRARESDVRLARQRALVERMEAMQLKHLLPEARRLLEMMESNQRLFSQQLRAIFDRTR
ncbi:hypothetical protein [Roseomonas sp. WA12]